MRAISRLTAIASTLLTCAALAACGGSKSTTPTAATPVPPVATVTALRISAPPAAIQVGNTFQLTATATLSNGLSASSGFSVYWSSSNPKVATASSTGLVTARAEGYATISASVTGSSDGLSFSALTYLAVNGRRLTGHVRITPATAYLGVPGARVMVTDGPYSGMSATTDAGGAFTIADVDGVLNLRISAPGFDDRQMTGDSALKEITMEIVRSDHPLIDSAEWAVPYGDARQVSRAELPFSMRSSGRVDLSAAAAVSSGESASFCSELRDDDNRLLWSQKTIWQGMATATVSLEGGRRYTLRISECAPGIDKPTMYQYRLFAIHPA